MLPRLRFVIASIAIAILPMVLLGSGAVPAPPASAPVSATHGSLGPSRTLPREARAMNEQQYRYERQAMSFARRSEELSRLRELASLPLAAWMQAPAGAPPEPAASEAPLPVAVAAEPQAVEPPAASPPPDAPQAPEQAAPLATAAIPTAEPESPPVEASAETPQVAAAPAAPPAEDASVPNKPAAEKAAADNAPAATTQAMLTLENGRKASDTPQAEAGVTQLTRVTVTARAKPRKVRRTIHRRSPRPAVVRAPPQQEPPSGPFAFFGWLFGQHGPALGQPAVPGAQPQVPAQPQARGTAAPAPVPSRPAGPPPRTAAR